jgi:hypothetical protein
MQPALLDVVVCTKTMLLPVLQKQEEKLVADQAKHQQEVAQKQEDAKAKLGLADQAAGQGSGSTTTTTSVQAKVDAAAAAAGSKAELPSEADMRAKYSTSTMKYAELVQRWVGWPEGKAVLTAYVQHQQELLHMRGCHTCGAFAHAQLLTHAQLLQMRVHICGSSGMSHPCHVWSRMGPNNQRPL